MKAALTADVKAALRALGVSEEQIEELTTKEATDEKSAGGWAIANKTDEKSADPWAAAGAEAVARAMYQTAMKRALRSYGKGKGATSTTGKFLSTVARAADQPRRRRQLR